MAIKINYASLVIVMSSAFARGIEDGITWHFHGDTPGRPMTEEDVVDFLQGNFIELLRQEFPALKRTLPTVWTNSYFVSTTAGAPLSVIKAYIEQQKHV